MNLQTTLLIGAGGFLGTILRYLLSTNINSLTGKNLLGTLTVNILGSFLIGLIYSVSAGKWDDQTVKILIVGVLGGFTTYSAFSAETFFLLKDSQWFLAIGYVLLMTGACLLATSAGFFVAKMV